MTQHAALSASGSSIWMNCTGSAALNAGKTRPSSVYAQEGTNAHNMGEDILHGRAVKPVTDEGQEMLDAVKVYTDFCKAITPIDVSTREIECRVNLDALWKDGEARPNDRMFGTCDYVCVHDQTLNIVDYKHGKGVPVDAKGNTQLRYYGLGALLTLSAAFRRVTQVNMTIVQPRAYHDDGPVRTESMTALDLMIWGREVLKPIVDRITIGDDTTLCAGSWCRWCPSLGECPEVHRQNMLTAKSEFTAVSDKPETLSNDKLADILNKDEMLRAWLAAVRAEASGRLDRGQKVPGWKLVNKTARRKWKDEARATLTLVSEGIPQSDLLTPPKIKSPAQVEKIVKRKKLKYEVMADLVEKPITGTTLVPADDRRQEVLAGPKQDFDIVSED